MPSEPFRFLHASDLQLDAPLTGTGPLDSDDRRVAEDATLTALDHVVDACLEQDVEFLLLTGSVFGCGQPTLRARRALLSAFENLCEFAIQVFWEVPRAELTAVFAESDELPGNVTPIDPADREPIAVVRQGRVIASVFPSVSADPVTHADGAHGDREERGAYRVGLVGQTHEPAALEPAAEYDYLATGSRGSRRTHQTRSAVLHHPGAVQGTTEAETGSHGATLVHVGVDRETELAFVPAAPVRWERMLVSVESGATMEQLRERMQMSLLELEPASTERLWIVNWEFVGNGELFEELQAGEAAAEELCERVRQGLAVGGRIHRYDRFRFRRRLAQHPDELTQQVCEWIACEETSPLADVLDELRALAGPDWQQAMTESLPLVDLARAQDAAKRLSQELVLPSAPAGIQRKRESR